MALFIPNLGSAMDKAPGTTQLFCVLVSSAQRGPAIGSSQEAQSCSARFVCLSQKTFADQVLQTAPGCRKEMEEGGTQPDILTRYRSCVDPGAAARSSEQDWLQWVGRNRVNGTKGKHSIFWPPAPLNSSHSNEL